MPATPKELIQPQLANIVTRSLFAYAFTRILAPAKVDIVNESTERANDLLHQGYSLWVLGNHFSKREGIELAARPAHLIPSLLNLPLVMPAAYHQYAQHQKLLDFIKKTMAVTIAPVVNQDTIDYKLNRDAITGEELPLGYGVLKYAALMNEKVTKPRYAGIALQAGRRKTLKLDQAKPRPLEFLIRRNKIMRGANKLAFIFMPMTIDEQGVDYEAVKDSYNWDRKYHIRFGPTLTLDEMYNILDITNGQLAKNPVEADVSSLTLDQLGLIILATGLNSDYNKINPNYVTLVNDIISAVRD